jgi:murein DD-endopeptidase MepM/ murein hydrolase activator NlpD
MQRQEFEDLLRHTTIYPVVPITAHDKLVLFDLTARNHDLNAETFTSTERFSSWVATLLEANAARYGIGGYGEHRVIYARSEHFDKGEEPRRLHLGVDIWGAAGTPVSAPLDGAVHSVAFNNLFGDYGGTVILQHQVNGFTFHTLYGHLSLSSLQGKEKGKTVGAGEVFAWFGMPEENGQWPPHLHFQIIIDMGGRVGDYPGVCRYSEREQWLANGPDPDVLLGLMERALAPSHRTSL